MMRIYVACLASYNSGILHGRWIEATADVDEMQEEIDAMLRESPCPNVTVACTVCEGSGEKTFHNSETGATRQGPCPSCNGCGTVLSAEEWAIHDTEGLPDCIGEFSGLEPVAAFVELVEDYSYLDAGELAEIVTDFGSVEAARDALEDGFCGIYDSFRDYADEYADEMIIACHDQQSGIIARYFDYDAFARDLAMDMHTIDLKSGRVAVFHA